MHTQSNSSLYLLFRLQLLAHILTQAGIIINTNDKMLAPRTYELFFLFSLAMIETH